MGQQFVNKKIEQLRKDAESSHGEIGKKIEDQKKKKSQRKLVVWSIVILVVLAGAAYGFYAALSPGKYDSFAKCLSEKGAVMYGAEWCKYTNAQKGMFGKSFKYVDYRIYDQDPNVKLTPTWIIKNQYYERVQDFNTLSQITGCSI